MKIFTAMLFFSDVPDGKIFQCEAIEYEKKIWLVGGWLENPQQGWKMPARLILLEGLPHQVTIGSPFGDYVLNQPISKAVFEGRESAGAYTVVERPDIRIPTPKGIH